MTRRQTKSLFMRLFRAVFDWDYLVYPCVVICTLLIFKDYQMGSFLFLSGIYSIVLSRLDKLVQRPHAVIECRTSEGVTLEWDDDAGYVRPREDN